MKNSKVGLHVIERSDEELARMWEFWQARRDGFDGLTLLHWKPGMGFGAERGHDPMARLNG